MEIIMGTAVHGTILQVFLTDSWATLLEVHVRLVRGVITMATRYISELSVHLMGNF